MERESVNLSFSPVPDIERILDCTIDALAHMDLEVLLQLASFCNQRETVMRLRHSVTDAPSARLSRKLLLYERLLQQTRVNLNVLGLEPERRTVVDDYRVPGRY